MTNSRVSILIDNNDEYPVIDLEEATPQHINIAK